MLQKSNNTFKDVSPPSPCPPSLTLAATHHLIPGSRSGAGPSPSAPRDVVASLVSTRFIKLTWRLPAEPHGDDVSYSVYYSLEGTNRERVVNTSRPGEMQVTIQNLMPDSKYSFRVVAHNRNGPGESSAPLRVDTQPEVLSGLLLRGDLSRKLMQVMNEHKSSQRT
ncbi:hypothetical protein DNTS_004599 [Danionella cerebrum]|uniref:Fibronectin type-III domain-containing protein n=1 Tax=Danionella cerebrum TaxID=2873325 RepID=A0A553RF09_9TELE|nr:hypothetical protein DNTS_004599 [Danionella translucida]